MSLEEKKLFDKEIKQANHYLEFGCGGSTFHMLQKSRAQVFSVDSSKEWIESLRRYYFIRKMEKNNRLHFWHADIGPTKEWGTPATISTKEFFPLYSSGVFNKIPREKIDRVLIDGRFRVACALKTMIECGEHPGLKILIHDFWNRDQYKVLLKYLEVENSAGTLAVFRIKENNDPKAILQEYEGYKFEPA